MMSKWQKYPAYKDSGIEWLGEIPEEWEVSRLGAYFLERKQKVSDKDYQPLSVTKKGVVPQLDTAAKTNDGDNRKLVRVGDFVINSRSDRKGSSGLSTLDGSVSFINIVLKPQNINITFCNYLLKSNSFVEEFYRNGHGIVADLWTTKYWDMKSIMINIPPKQEQIKIASYLDKKTSQIDKAIRQKEKLIKLLKEYRQIIINEAVTKGVDENGKLRVDNGDFKDSGIEWIGRIPKHWDVRKLKYLLNLQNEKINAKGKNVIALENIESFTGKYVQTNSQYEDEGVFFEENNILFGKLRPYLAKVFFCKFEGIAFGDLLVYKATSQYFPKFAFYRLLSSDFIKIVNSSTYGTKMPRANPSYIGNLKLPLPPFEEQKQIADFLDNQTTKIDKALHLQQNYIEKLKEYKATLIDSVVTGKVRIV